jgi:cation transport ATPase
MLLVPLTWSVLRSLSRGDVGVDAFALVSMAGALALREYLAGAVVALMLAGGNALEEAANRRARRERSRKPDDLGPASSAFARTYTL